MDKNKQDSWHDVRPGDKVILEGILVGDGGVVHGLVATAVGSYSIDGVEYEIADE